MLRRSAKPKGLCVNCAAHDQLRHLYPANLILAQSGPKGLMLPHIQQMFDSILRSAGTDADPGEIDWERVVANWNLPFSTKIKSTSTNPVTQKEFDRQGTKPHSPSFLTEQEQRAKDKATRDHAMRDFLNILSPGERFYISDDGYGNIAATVAPIR